MMAGRDGDGRQAPALAAMLDDRRLIRLAGRDVRDFLQRIITQDVAALAPARAVPAALLTPQGKLLHLFLLTALPDGGVLLETSAEEERDLLRLLTLYRLRADVAITPLEGGRVFAADARPLEASEAAAAADGVIHAADARAPDLLARLYLLPDAPADAVPWAADGDGAARYAHARAREGLPEGPAELPPGRLFALEADLDLMGAVSFTKGCYVGQEVTTRSYRRGRVKKRLVPFVVPTGAGPAAGAALARAGETVAHVIAPARHGIGWALARLEALEEALAAGELSCERPEGPVVLRIPARLRKLLAKTPRPAGADGPTGRGRSEP